MAKKKIEALLFSDNHLECSSLFGQILGRYIHLARACENMLETDSAVRIYLPSEDKRALACAVNQLIKNGRPLEAKMAVRLIWNQLTFGEFCEVMSEGMKEDMSEMEIEEYLQKREWQARDPLEEIPVPF